MGTLLLTKLHSSHISLVFSLMSFFCSRNPSRVSDYPISAPCLPSLLWCVRSSDGPCFWWPWQLWGGHQKPGQVFPRMPLLEDNNYCRMFYPRVDELWIWGRKMTEVKRQFHDVISKVRAVNFTLWMMLFSSDHLARVVFAKFSHYTLSFPYFLWK